VRRALARLLRRDAPVPLAEGLEVDGQPVLTCFAPPWFPSMEAAVHAVVDRKFGPNGIFRGAVGQGAWREPERIATAAREPSAAAIDATVAYCEYVFRRYGRFPAYPAPFRTLLGYQAGHVDVGFYERHYGPAGLTETQREHMARWHR